MGFDHFHWTPCNPASDNWKSGYARPCLLALRAVLTLGLHLARLAPMGHDRTGRVRTGQSQARVPGLYIMQSTAVRALPAPPATFARRRRFLQDSGYVFPERSQVSHFRGLLLRLNCRVARCTPLRHRRPRPSSLDRIPPLSHFDWTVQHRYARCAPLVGTSAALRCIFGSVCAPLHPPPVLSRCVSGVVLHLTHLTSSIHPSSASSSSALLLFSSCSPSHSVNSHPILAPVAAGSWLPALSISSLSQLGFRLQSVPSPP